MQSKNDENEPTRHHILPRSQGGKHTEDNIAIVRRKQHEVYHHLFGNKTPDEIIVYLVYCFWNGQWDWVQAAQERKKRSA